MGGALYKSTARNERTLDSKRELLILIETNRLSRDAVTRINKMSCEPCGEVASNSTGPIFLPVATSTSQVSQLKHH